MDTRRELDHVARHFDRHASTVGVGVVWFELDRETTDYHPVYDEGPARTYLRGILLPVLGVVEDEAPKRVGPQGRRPHRRMEVVIGYAAARDAGLSYPHDYERHLLDVLLFGQNYYTIVQYRTMGRIREDDTVISVTAEQLWPDEDMPYDELPRWP